MQANPNASPTFLIVYDGSSGLGEAPQTAPKTAASSPIATRTCSKARGNSSSTTARSPRRTASTSTWRLNRQTLAPRPEQGYLDPHGSSKHPPPGGKNVLREREPWRQVMGAEAQAAAAAAVAARTRVAELAVLRREWCARRRASLLVALINRPGLWLKRRCLVCSSLLLWDRDRGCPTRLSKASSWGRRWVGADALFCACFCLQLLYMRVGEGACNLGSIGMEWPLIGGEQILPPDQGVGDLVVCRGATPGFYRATKIVRR